MRKFSTYDGLYTNKPSSLSAKPITPRQTAPQPCMQDDAFQPEEVPITQLSAKAIKCYTAIKQHDDLVKSLLNKS